jgi:hypothetical protein
MKRLYFRILCPLLALVLVPCAGLAEPADTVVASNGTIHKLRQGLYSELFPDGGAYEADPEAAVLALEVVDNGRVERFLVPGTDDPYIEKPAALHFARESGATYILWEGLVSGLHPFLHLVAFDGVTWSEIIDITGNVFADKASAELVILPEPEPENQTQLLEATTSRSVIYVAWKEISPNGTQKYLVPIILQNGLYLGWHNSLRLSSLVSGDDLDAAVDPDLDNLLRIQPSSKDNTVVVGFTDPNTGRLATLEVEMLPQALSAIAAHVEGLIREYAQTSSTVHDLARKIRTAIMSFNDSFHRGTLAFLASETESLLLEQSTVAAAVAPGIPEKFGVHMIGGGARVRSKGLIDPEPREIIEMGQTREGGGPFHHLKISILADREPPEVGGPAVLFLSSTGLEALVAWEEEKGIAFRETEGAAWGERQVVGLSDDLDKQDVYRILADRTLNR